MYWKILISIALIYIIFMFILSQFFIPNLRFKTKKQKVPKNIKNKINLIVKKSKKKEEVLKEIIDLQLSIFYSRMKTVFKKFKLLFEGSVDKLLKKKGILHCQQQSLILRTMLLETCLFKENDIKLKITACYGNIHQYLLINIGEKKPKWIKVDVFAMSLGYPLGEKLNFFHYSYHKKKKYKEMPIKFNN